MNIKENNYKLIREVILRHEVYQSVKDYSKEKEKVSSYFELGKLLFNINSVYGENTINEYSKKLSKKFGKNYSYRNLINYRKFYSIFKNDKLNALRSKLSWTHYRELIKLKNIDEIVYYIEISIEKHLSYRNLIEKIKNNEYERLDDKTKIKLINNEDKSIIDFVKNPIQIKSNTKEDITEKVLQKLILEDIESFMNELGDSFSFIGSEYKIKLGDKYNYIDLLLFNIEFNCFVVVELKVTELKKEHLGQIQVYMNYIDEKLRKVTQGKTIGIIICKQNNKYVIKYCSDDRVIARAYELVL